jgi:predicted MFS family arabinose efflux permease
MLRIPGMPALVGMSLLGFTSFFLTLSALPVYAVGRGVPEALAGLVTTVMLIATVTAQLVVPAAVERIGQRATLIIGLIALGAPTPLLLLSDQLWWLLAVSAVRGIGFAILTVLTPLVATQIAPPGSHGRAIGLYGLAVAVPNVLAVPAAVALTTAGHFPVVAVLAAIPLLAIPLAGQFPEPPTRTARRSAGPPLPTRRLAGILALLLALTLSGGGIFAILPVQLADPAAVTWALLALGVTSALARWRAGALADRAGPARLLPACAAIGVIGLIMLALGVSRSGIVSGVLVVLGTAMFGIAYGGAQNLTLLLSFDLAGSDRRAGASAAWNATYDAGTAIGALLVGAIAAGSSLSVALSGCAALVVMTAVTAVSGARQTKPPPS